MLDHIEYNVEQSKTYVKKGVDELREANRLQKKSRKVFTATNFYFNSTSENVLPDLFDNLYLCCCLDCCGGLGKSSVLDKYCLDLHPAFFCS